MVRPKAIQINPAPTAKLIYDGLHYQFWSEQSLTRQQC
jgi:hypothetical protein